MHTNTYMLQQILQVISWNSRVGGENPTNDSGCGDVLAGQAYRTPHRLWHLIKEVQL
jgi:hypothetical protein